MRYLIALLWLVVFTKKLLFWIYLWQLKEYHLGRFLDHFQTYKGKKLFLDYLLLIKILIFSGIIITARLGFSEFKFDLVYLTALIFLLEAVFSFKNFWKRTFKKPIWTQKTAFLFNLGISGGILIVFFSFLLELKLTRFTALFLLFDILIPVILSVMILIFQPLAAILRYRFIKKAKKKRESFKNLLVIGITGSYGKTSTKEFLATILSARFKVLKTQEHQNSEVGISQCILNELTEDHEIFICEMGAYNKGGIKLLCDIAKPKIGVLTGINEQHMATFGSLENIIKTKYELIESLPQGGLAFFNGKNKYCQELYQKTLRPSSLRGPESAPQGQSKAGQASIKSFLYGENSGLGLENLEGAKVVAKALGMTDEEIELAVRKIENKFPGIKIRDGIDGLRIIDATFSANPNSVITHLEYLKGLGGRKIVVMPCLIELGKASKEVHERIGQKIAEVCDLAIITTKDRFKEIKAVSIPLRGTSASQRKVEVVFVEDSKKIFEKIKEFCSDGDAVLLESRVPNQLIDLLIK